MKSYMSRLSTGLRAADTKRDVFEADFIFVAGSVEDPIGNQRKHDALTDSSGMVPYLSCDSSPAQPHQGVDFPLMCSRHTITGRTSHD